MQTRKDDSAFAYVIKDDEWSYHRGLTKREYFAAIALQGILAKGDIHLDSAAYDAIQQADELIRELNRTDSNAI